MANRVPMSIGEWYHCYTRGVDKRVVFEDDDDYHRFLIYLYVSNSTENVRVSNLSENTLSAIVANNTIKRGSPLVEIAAYSLMPTHSHFLLREIREHGISTFMQKAFTGYTMYFNNKNQRTGALFSGTFKSRHVKDDAYLKQVVPYILLNHVALIEPEWKTGHQTLSSTALKEKLLEYPYSSLRGFLGIRDIQNKIINASLDEYYDRLPTLAEMLSNARMYYQEQNPQV